MDRALASQFTLQTTADVVSWLDQVPSVLTPKGSSDVYTAKQKLLERSAKEKRPPPSHSELVAELDFGFWTGLLGNNYFFQSAADPRLGWPLAATKVFPHYGGVVGKDFHKIRTALHDIRKFRNRVFHHEPILPKSGIVQLNRVSTHLQTRRAWILNSVGWISPELRQVVERLDRVSEVLEPRFYRQLCFRLLLTAT
jgi:hypothetical protein